MKLETAVLAGFTALAAGQDLRKKQVDINHPIAIDPAYRLMRTPYLAFYFLGEMKHGQRRKKRFHAGRRIQKRMFRRKAPRSSSIKSGQGNDFPYPLFYFPDSETEIVLLVAEISS